MNAPVQLDGTKRLWDEPLRYAEFAMKNADEVYSACLAGDENAGLIVDIVCAERRDPFAMAALMISVERFISEHHPEIAIIVSGYYSVSKPTNGVKPS